MNMQLIKEITATQIRTDLPEIEVGDSVKVSVKIVEGNKQRVQVFAGVIIRIKGSGVSKTFTVRKASGQFGVERIFPINSPIISKLEVTRKSKVRRSKLYYLRERSGKAARLKERKI